MPSHPVQPESQIAGGAASSGRHAGGSAAADFRWRRASAVGKMLRLGFCDHFGSLAKKTGAGHRETSCFPCPARELLQALPLLVVFERKVQDFEQEDIMEPQQSFSTQLTSWRASFQTWLHVRSSTLWFPHSPNKPFAFDVCANVLIVNMFPADGLEVAHVPFAHISCMLPMYNVSCPVMPTRSGWTSASFRPCQLQASTASYKPNGSGTQRSECVSSNRLGQLCESASPGPVLAWKTLSRLKEVVPCPQAIQPKEEERAKS